MWISILVLIMILAITLWIMLGQLVCTINSEKDLYEISALGILKGGFSFENDDFIIYFTLPFYQKNVHIDQWLESRQSKVKKPEKKKETAGSKRPRPRIDFNKILKILATFKIEKLELDIDTRNPTLNGILYPLVSLIRTKGYQVNINFLGRQNIQLTIQNRIIRILKAYIF